MLACRYIFGIYDFDESGVLSVDETILALRSTISGLCKLCGLDPPLESEIEVIALMVGDIQYGDLTVKSKVPCGAE